MLSINSVFKFSCRFKDFHGWIIFIPFLFYLQSKIIYMGNVKLIKNSRQKSKFKDYKHDLKLKNIQPL